jgi:hypothetical protein
MLGAALATLTVASGAIAWRAFRQIDRDTARDRRERARL